MVTGEDGGAKRNPPAGSALAILREEEPVERARESLARRVVRFADEVWTRVRGCATSDRTEERQAIRDATKLGVEALAGTLEGVALKGDERLARIAKDYAEATKLNAEAVRLLADAHKADAESDKIGAETEKVRAETQRILLETSLRRLETASHVMQQAGFVFRVRIDEASQANQAVLLGDLVREETQVENGSNLDAQVEMNPMNGTTLGSSAVVDTPEP